MKSLSDKIFPESRLTHRERKILEYNALLSPSSTSSRVTEDYLSGGHQRDIISRSGRSPEPPIQATRLSTHKRGRVFRPFRKFSDALICRLASFLNPALAICLSVTCRRFEKLIETDKNSLSRCEKWFVMACLEQDYIDRYPPQSAPQSSIHHQRSRNSGSPQSSCGSSSHQRRSRHSSTQHFPSISDPSGFNGLTCALCKVKHGPETWGQTSPRFWTFTTHALFQTKSVERLCSWHFEKLVFPIRNAVPSSTGIPRWVSSRQEMCMHCGKVQMLEKCHCLVKTSHPGALYPECEICPSEMVRVYARPGTQEEFDAAGWRFCTEKKGTMFVREDLKGNDLLLCEH